MWPMFMYYNASCYLPGEAKCDPDGKANEKETLLKLLRPGQTLCHWRLRTAWMKNCTTLSIVMPPARPTKSDRHDARDLMESDRRGKGTRKGGASPHRSRCVALLQLAARRCSCRRPSVVVAGLRWGITPVRQERPGWRWAWDENGSAAF